MTVVSMGECFGELLLEELTLSMTVVSMDECFGELLLKELTL